MLRAWLAHVEQVDPDAFYLFQASPPLQLLVALQPCDVYTHDIQVQLFLAFEQHLQSEVHVLVLARTAAGGLLKAHTRLCVCFCTIICMRTGCC